MHDAVRSKVSMFKYVAFTISCFHEAIEPSIPGLLECITYPGASTKSLSWWLRPQDMLYNLRRHLTREPFGLEVQMQNRHFSYLALNIPFKMRVGRDSNSWLLSHWLLIPCQGTNSTKSLSWWLWPHDMRYTVTGSWWKITSIRIYTLIYMTVFPRHRIVIHSCHFPLSNWWVYDASLHYSELIAALFCNKQEISGGDAAGSISWSSGKHYWLRDCWNIEV